MGRLCVAALPCRQSPPRRTFLGLGRRAGVPSWRRRADASRSGLGASMVCTGRHELARRQPGLLPLSHSPVYPLPCLQPCLQKGVMRLWNDWKKAAAAATVTTLMLVIGVSMSSKPALQKEKPSSAAPTKVALVPQLCSVGLGADCFSAVARIKLALSLLFALVRLPA